MAFESGTPNSPAIAGLAAALDHLDHHGMDHQHAHGLLVIDAIAAELHAVLGSRLQVHAAPADRARVAVWSCTIDGLDPAEAGFLLEAAGIQVRTGYHCAPWIHPYLGTAAAGTVRFSAGPFVSADAALQVAQALAG